MAKANTSPTNRAKMSNGTKLFIDGKAVDGRTPIARRYRDIYADLVTHVGGEPNPAQDILIRRAATLALLSDLDDAEVAAGRPIDTNAYIGRANALSGLLTKLGMTKAVKDITPKGTVLDAHARAVIEGAE